MPPKRRVVQPSVSCDDIVTLPQHGETCWFNTIITAMFYSDRMRQFFLSKLSSIETHLKDHPVVFGYIDYILRSNYRVSRHHTVHFYRSFSPETILAELHRANNQLFPTSPKEFAASRWMGLSTTYVPLLLQFMHLKHHAFFLSYLDNFGMDRDEFVPNAFNKTMVPYITKRSGYPAAMIKPAPDGPDTTDDFKNANPALSADELRMVVMRTRKTDSDAREVRFDHIRVQDDTLIVFLTSALYKNVPDRIVFKNATFVLDAMLITNYNPEQCHLRHQIAGITCRKRKFLYNSVYVNESAEPCKLMAHEWNDHTGTFCMDVARCAIIKTNATKHKLTNALCFDTKRSERTYMYVRSTVDKNTRSASKRPRPVDLEDIEFDMESLLATE